MLCSVRRSVDHTGSCQTSTCVLMLYMFVPKGAKEPMTLRREQLAIILKAALVHVIMCCKDESSPEEADEAVTVVW